MFIKTVEKAESDNSRPATQSVQSQAADVYLLAVNSRQVLTDRQAGIGTEQNISNIDFSKAVGWLVLM